MAIRKAREVSTLNRPNGYVSLYDIKTMALPGRYLAKADYDPYDDHNPAAKWIGRLEGASTHVVTILAHQHAAGEVPSWTVRAFFNDKSMVGTIMEVKWTTMEMKPARFMEELALIERAILDLEERYLSKGY